MKITTNQEEINQVLSNTRKANNCTLVVDDEYNGILLVYSCLDHIKRRNATEKYLKDNNISTDNLEFAEYTNGNETTFTI